MMKISKFFFAFIIFLATATCLKAQVNEVDSTEANVEPAVIYPYELIVFDERDKKQYKILVEDPIIIEQRLKQIEKQMPFVYNSNVKLWLDFFMIRRPSFTRSMLEEKDAFFPIFEKYLEKNAMPTELKYLSLLESGLNPKAISRSKAVGLWQFMSFTGKEFGLKIDNYVDERMHIEKSTDAACKYLKQLYGRFSDWELALASYNTGPNRIARVMKSTGYTSYWDLHPHIHPDTRAYVPQFIALAYMMNYANDHGIYAQNKKDFVPVEKIEVNSYLNLKVFSELSQINLEDIKRHNPHLKTNVLPESYETQLLALPTEKLAYFNKNKAFILDSASKKPAGIEKMPEVLSETKQLPDGTIVIGRNVSKPTVSEELEEDIVKYKSIVKQVKKIHKVKRGEFLIRIADKYDVTPNEIKRWNKMRSSKVMYGTRLVIYTNQKQKVKTIERVAKKSKEDSIVTNKKELAKADKKKADKKKEESEKELEAVLESSSDSKTTSAKKKKEIEKLKKEELAEKKSKKNEDSKDEVAKKKNKKEDKLEAVVSKSKSKIDAEKTIVHLVRKGDTLWNICQKYAGVTVDDIKKLNKISGNTVKVGQKIKIKTS